MARWQSNNSILWQLFAFLIGAQTAVGVALTQVQAGSYLQFLVGCVGLGGLGLFGPLAIRFIETILLLDRLLLDQYEERLLPERELRLYHGRRLRDRMEMIRGHLQDDQLATLSKRRLAKLGKQGARLDKLLDIFGQPSLIWTMVVAGAGVGGFDFGFLSWNVTASLVLPLQIAVISIFDGILLSIALLSVLGVGGNPSIKRREYWDSYFAS